MIILPSNYAKYAGYEYLLNNQKEPLFLKPDGVRTRYCIGWNGKGRYLPGTLKVTYNGLPCNISEEKNGIFFNFEIAPDSNTNYDDYEVSYITVPLDYAFSTGLPEGGYEGEEYFLFPNWNNALGEGDAFWIGKWQASNNGSNIPQSKSGVNLWGNNIIRNDAIAACKRKGKGFGMVTNREWVSIALWTSHHEIHVKGNINGKKSDNLDGDYTTLNQCGGGYTLNNYYIITGNTLPDTWSHNGKSGGIYNLTGNMWEFIDGLENRSGKIYIYDKNNNYVDSGVSVSNNTSGYAVDITNTTEAILNEGIPNTVSTDGYIPSNLDKAFGWYDNNQFNSLLRGGSTLYSVGGGVWSFFTIRDAGTSSWDFNFRLARKI